MHNTSKAALADHVATTCNAICIVDEYRNDLEMEKREFFKGLWDGTGRTRMNMDKDKKKETTNVDQGVIVCGQQMATADIALFSRFIILSFNQTTYSKEEEQKYKELEELNKHGLTHITHQILKTRSFFQSNYKTTVENLGNKYRKILKKDTIESRIFNNWLSVIAAYSTIHQELDIPWDHDEFILQTLQLMKIQNKEIKRNDDLGSFWKIVQYFLSSNMIFEGGDYKTDFTDSIIWRKGNTVDTFEPIKWIEPKHIFYLTTSRIFNLYKNQVLKEGDKPLPESTIEHYLKHTPAFICETKKEGFKKIDPKTGLQEVRNEKKMRTSTTALVFDLSKLNLTIPTDTEEKEEEPNNEKNNETIQDLSDNSLGPEPQNELPF